MEKETEKILDKNLCNILEEDIFIPDEFINTILKTQYKKNRKIILLNRVAIFIFGIIIAAGITGVAAFQYFIQKNNSINYHEKAQENYFKSIERQFDMTDEELFYKVILNYEEYTKYTANFNGLIEMSEDDFKNNFLIVIASSWKYPNISISNITSDSNTMYVEVDSKNENISKDDIYIISSKVSNELYRDTVSIYKRKEQITNKKYEKLENLPNVYTIDSAEKDNCVVITNSKILDHSKTILDNFVINTQKGVSDMVRIAVFNNNQENNNLDVVLYDIEFKNNEFVAYQDATRNSFDKSNEILYLGKFQYFNIDDNKILKIMKLGNFTNDSIIIGTYKE